jgi:tetratricopeptide (TPR) repeat protein
MNYMKKYSKTSSLFVMSIATSLIVICNTGCQSKGASAPVVQTENVLALPALYERTGELAKTDEWTRTREKVAELTAKINMKQSDVKSRLQLATIFISEARITGQHGYYDPQIYKILDGVLALDSKNFEAYVYKSSVKMSQHRFADALQLAEKARSINPDNAYVYGMLVDANVELGHYETAVQMSDKMESIKPSLESYSRASYLREIYGDYPGAVEAMKMAVAAGIPGSESGEWSRVALGDLYLNMGNIDSAESIYKMSLSLRPAFPRAEIGLAKVEKARKNYDAAIAHTEAAIKVVSESGYVTMLGELYALKGDKEKSAEIFSDVTEMLEKAEQEQAGSASPHNGSRELAQAWLNAGDLKKAMAYAEKDLATRPENIDANELVAWIAYRRGDWKKAADCAAFMLKTNTNNANTLYKAGLIYLKSGDTVKAASLMKKAQSVSHYIDESILQASI